MVPTNVLVFAPASSIGMEIQCVPSGEISTVLSNPSSVATKESVDAEPRKLFAAVESPLTSGTELTDSVPRATLILPVEVGAPNMPAEVGTIHTKLLLVLEILIVCVPIRKPSGCCRLIVLVLIVYPLTVKWSPRLFVIVPPNKLAPSATDSALDELVFRLASTTVIVTRSLMSGASVSRASVPVSPATP